MPIGYLQTILVGGYHLRFLSEDRKSGGHLHQRAAFSPVVVST
jgi:alpha-acetolactate decarboxylase